MNDQKILALMATKADMRAVQISDAFDISLKDASDAMRDLVEVGSVVQSKGVAPNQQQCMVYNLSDDFKNSREGRAILGAAPVPVPQVGVAPIVVPVFLPKPETPSVRESKPADVARSPRKSKASLGVDFIISNKQASIEQLRTAMGLLNGQYPAAFLGAAVAAGKVHSENGVWCPGPAAQLPADRRTADVGIEGRALAHQPVAPSGMPSEVKLGDLMVDSVGSPVFRCGLWSDGVIELQRDGVTIAQLVQREGEHLAGFINRMLAKQMGADTQQVAARGQAK